MPAWWLCDIVRHTIRHEASHLLDYIDDPESERFKDEYRAEQRTIQTSYCLGDYKAIRRITKMRIEDYKKTPDCDYARGVIDTVADLCDQHPNDTKLQKIGREMAFQLGDSSEVMQQTTIVEEWDEEELQSGKQYKF